MPFRRVGPDRYVSPSGRHFTGAQVRRYYATRGFTRDGNFEVRVQGQDRVERAFEALYAQFGMAAQRALRVEAEIEMGEMKARTPVRTGALRASGRVEDLPGGGIRWAFGGPAIDYAVAVHENLEAFHRVGQAKYMESVLAESMPHLGARVAARLRQLLAEGR